MLHLLTQLLPPGRTSHYGVSPDNDLQVQLYLDDGSGPAMIRVAVDRLPSTVTRPPARDDVATVTVNYVPDKCEQSTMVHARWPDGTLVEVDVATCLGDRGTPTRPALTTEQAIRVASDPRWGVTMDPNLIKIGARQFPSPVPVIAR